MSDPLIKRTICFFRRLAGALILLACVLAKISPGQKAELVVQTGHSMPVSFLAFSPDGRFIVSGDGRTTKLWDVATRRELRTLDELMTDYLIDYRRFRFSSDSRLAVDGNRVIDLATREDIVTFPSVVAAEAFLNRDGTRFLTTNGAYVRAWPMSDPTETIFIYRTNAAVMNERRMLFASFGKPEKIPKGQASENANSSVYSSYSPYGSNSNAYSNTSSANTAWSSNTNRPSQRRSAGRVADNAVHIFSLETEKQIARIPGFTSAPKKIAFTDDGKRLITVESTALKMWDVDTGKLLASLAGTFDDLRTLVAAPDGRSIVYAIEYDGEEFVYDYRFWSIDKPVAASMFAGRVSKRGGLLPDIDYSPDGKLVSVSEFSHRPDQDIVTASVRLLDASTGAEIKKLELGRMIKSSSQVPVAFSPDGQDLAVARNNEFEIWNIEKGRRTGVFEGYANRVEVISLANDGATIAETGVRRPQAPDAGDAADLVHSTFLWPMTVGDDPKEIIGGIKYTGPFSASGYLMMSSGGQLINRHNRYLVTEMSHYKGRWEDMTEAQRRATLEYRVWDTENGAARPDLSEQINTRNREVRFSIDDAAVSPDGSKICLVRNPSAAAGKVEMWDTAPRKLLWQKELPPSDGSLQTYAAFFDASGKTVAVAGIVFDVQTGNVNVNASSQSMAGGVDNGQADYGRVRIGETEVAARVGIGRIGLYDVATRELKAELYWLNESDWAVVTPEGLWDASPGARRLMHYVVGFEPVSLEQTKAGYYLHDLLSKIFRGVALPRVTPFSADDLFPEITLDPPREGESKLRIKLRNRGGGIGPVQVLVNDKEFVADARPPGFDPRSATADFLVDFENAPLVASGENRIEVVARNVSGSLSSRGAARGEALVISSSSAKREPPNIYAIIAGVSDYAGENLKLNYAAKDAEDIARAIELGALRLVGDPKKVHIRLLTSSGPKAAVKLLAGDAKQSAATKSEIENAFREFATATSDDIFIVYLAGHGVSLNLNPGLNVAGDSTYLYLTQEATTADTASLRLENTRRAMTLSGDELKDLMKKNRALKQVLILDTCAAGNVADSFVKKRDTPADQVAALERLKDSIGFFILMGSASDAVSYEAGEYGQGLLTRALLQGMQGEKLRFGEYADIEPLFGYARDTVVELAGNIGGIQRPETITPFASRSFDIGRFTAAERAQLTLPSKRPRILRPTLQNDRLRFDDLQLEEAFGAAIRSYARTVSRGLEIVFIDARDVPDAIRPSGGYVLDGAMLTITVVLVKNNKAVGSEIKVTGRIEDKDALLRQLVEKVVERSRAAQTSP